MGLENYIPANLLLWIEPIITILLGLVLGLFFKKFLVSRLISLSEKNNWQSDDVVINAINSVIVFWFFLAFSSIAVGNSELPGPEDIYQKIISAFLIIGPNSIEVCISSPVRSKKPVFIKNTLFFNSLMHSFRFNDVRLSSSIIPHLIVYFSMIYF